MRVHEIAEKYPQVQMVSSDYRKYSIYSKRFKKIIARYSNQIESGGIDECYAILELDSSNGSIREYLQQIQAVLELELGMTFSIGSAATKALAKLASGMNKPSGITILEKETLLDQIGSLPLARVSGIGWQSEPKMNALGLYTIADFICKSPEWILSLIHI